MPNLFRSQRTADRLIRRWGKGSVAKLIRAGVPRDCRAARSSYTPKERGLFADGAERFYISALGIEGDLPPDHEQDVLSFKGEGQSLIKIYKIIVPPEGPRPNGLVMFYDCSCMYSETL